MAEATTDLINIFAWEKGKFCPTLPYDTIQEVIMLPFPQNFDLYCSMMDITLKPWQRQECLNIIKNHKYLFNWGRGMSKTLLLVLVAVFLGLFGIRTIYLVPRVDELEQPMDYFNGNCFVDCNPHKRSDKTFSLKKGTWYRILGKLVIKISNVDDHGFNVSSGRFNYVIYDECALLMYYAKEVELFNKAAGMLRAMDYPHRIWASTPLIGSHFVTMKEDLEAHDPDSFSWRNFENTPDNFLTDTPEKRAQMEEERQDAIRQGILHAWETENLAIPRTAQGRAFKNIIEESFDNFVSTTHNRIGFDFHGYKVGHIWVACYYWPDAYPRDIWIIAEGAERYLEESTADESMLFLKNNPFFNCYLCGESGGLINDPYIKASRQFGMNDVSILGEEKHSLEANVLNYTIHVDKLRTPNFYRDVTEAEWKDFNKFELHKEPSGKKFRNHYLDAFMNQLPLFQGAAGIYIPNRKLRRISSFAEQDRLAHHVHT